MSYRQVRAVIVAIKGRSGEGRYASRMQRVKSRTLCKRGGMREGRAEDAVHTRKESHDSMGG